MLNYFLEILPLTYLLQMYTIHCTGWSSERILWICVCAQPALTFVKIRKKLICNAHDRKREDKPSYPLRNITITHTLKNLVSNKIHWSHLSYIMAESLWNTILCHSFQLFQKSKRINWKQQKKRIHSKHNTEWNRRVLFVFFCCWFCVWC